MEGANKVAQMLELYRNAVIDQSTSALEHNAVQLQSSIKWPQQPVGCFVPKALGLQVVDEIAPMLRHYLQLASMVAVATYAPVAG